MIKRSLIITLITANVVSIFFNIEPYIYFFNLIAFTVLLLLMAKKSEDIIEEAPIVNTPKVMEPTKKEINEESGNRVCEEDINSCNYQLKELAKRFFYFKTSIPVIERLSKSTKDFEEITLKKVFDQFEEIWKESETIVLESEETMESIFDTTKSQNMGYILDSSKEINRDFSEFLPELENMSSLTDIFINTSLDSFKDISRTTKEIEELAEQVKVISINVRIEAARVKDSGGFKVLGEDITNFADKTTMFAKSTNDRIQHTLGEIEALKTKLSEKLAMVKNMVNSMYKKVNPFEEILENSSSSLKVVINDLNKISGELNSNLKTSLGNLQYQDVTSQETAHIIEFLNSIECSEEECGEIVNLVSESEKTELKRSMLQYLDRISTTGNEDQIIKEIASEWNISYKDEHNENFSEVDDGTFLF